MKQSGLKFFILLTLFMMQPLISFQQITSWVNLVPNYSFENVYSGYPNNNNIPNMTCPTTNFSDMQDYWNEIYNWNLPYRRILTCKPATPDVLTIAPYGYGFGSEPPSTARSGIRYGHGTPGEYLVVELSEPLQPGRMYFFECFSNNTGKSVMFSKERPKQCDNGAANLVNGPFLGILDLEMSFVSDADEIFTRGKVYFSPLFEVRWLTIGSNTGGGQVEDVRIYEVGNAGCRDNWYFDNTVFNYPFEFFQASDRIYVGNSVDPENGINHIPGDVIQYAGTSVVLQAQNQVIIENTFIMEPGSTTLVIENKPCQNSLCPDPLVFNNHLICNTPTQEIGVAPAAWGSSVSWSPASYLNNPNISNPTFYSPSGTGVVNYTVTVTYTCDGGFQSVMTYPVSVNYVNTNNSTADIQANNVVWDDYSISTELSFSAGVNQIQIEVPSSPGYSEVFYQGLDYSCCTFNWELPEAWQWSSCSNDEIIITAKNQCNSIENTITIQWPKTQTPFASPALQNALTPNDDGVNDALCFNIVSADFYDIWVGNIYQNTMYQSYGEVESSFLCTWAPEQNSLSDGIYFYILELSDLCGNVQTYQQFIQVFNGRMHEGGSQQNEFEFTDDIGYELNAGLEVDIYPNPSQNMIYVKSDHSEIVETKIYTYSGTLLISHVNDPKDPFVDCTSLAEGVYLVEVWTNNGVAVRKLFIQR
jgi:hypothetical protein